MLSMIVPQQIWRFARGGGRWWRGKGGGGEVVGGGGARVDLERIDAWIGNR